jgi:TetR/AcrR family transcriptional regulator, transcriptional repressor for nem operon
MGNKGDTNRERIIEAADKLFYARGYNQTSFRDISVSTGIPRGNFYYYFKTKDDILGAVIESRLKFFSGMLAQCESIATQPTGRLLAFADMLETLSDNIVEVGCPIGSLTVELAKDEPHLQRKSREIFELLRDWLEGNFKEIGVSQPKDAAMDLLAHIQGVSVMACAFKDNAYMHRGLENVKAQLRQLTLN